MLALVTIFLRSLAGFLSPIFCFSYFMTSQSHLQAHHNTGRSEKGSHFTYLYRHYYKPLQRPPCNERTDPATA